MVKEIISLGLKLHAVEAILSSLPFSYITFAMNNIVLNFGG